MPWHPFWLIDVKIQYDSYYNTRQANQIGSKIFECKYHG